MPLLPVNTTVSPPARELVRNCGAGGVLASARRNSFACFEFEVTVKVLDAVVVVPSHKLVATKIPGGNPAKTTFCVYKRPRADYSVLNLPPY